MAKYKQLINELKNELKKEKKAKRLKVKEMEKALKDLVASLDEELYVEKSICFNCDFSIKYGMLFIYPYDCYYTYPTDLDIFELAEYLEANPLELLNHLFYKVMEAIEEYYEIESMSQEEIEEIEREAKRLDSQIRKMFEKI